MRTVRCAGSGSLRNQNDAIKCFGDVQVSAIIARASGPAPVLQGIGPSPIAPCRAESLAILGIRVARYSLIAELCSGSLRKLKPMPYHTSLYHFPPASPRPRQGL